MNSADAYISVAREAKRQAKPVQIAFLTAVGGVGVFTGFKYMERARYRKMVSEGEPNAAAAQRAYELLPQSVRRSNFLMRAVLPDFLFKVPAEVEDFFRSDTFKSRYFAVVTNVTDEGLFKRAFKAMYGFDLYGVLTKVLSTEELAAIRTEAGRAKVRAEVNEADRGKYIVADAPLGADDLMYFLDNPKGWATGYAWVGAVVPKGIYLGKHDGTEVYKVKDGKTTRRGYRFVHYQQVEYNGKKITAKMIFLVDSSKVKLAKSEPTVGKFNFWNYYRQEPYVRDYIAKIQAARELYNRMYALDKNVPVYERAMSKPGR